jgi:hydrogenase maturation protein HypF
MHRRLVVRGRVQGVGFRPWVWQQATSLGVVGWVRDTPAGVEIDLHGDPVPLDALQARLWQAPLPAHVEQVEVMALRAGEEAVASRAASARPIEIQASIEGTHARATNLGTDLGVCNRCLSEVFDPANRRWRHAFTHCPQCGPRYTLTRSLPYDRAHTSMARFRLCMACEAEYQDGNDRRFHHQTNACPACGPSLWLRLPDGSMDTREPIAAALQVLRDGGILAVKSLGGFHLCCDARQPAAIARLRDRKHRETQPLAIMAANVDSVRSWVECDKQAQRWLQSPERPIVLLRQTERAQAELPTLAPGLASLGVMLACTPVHHLLFHEACGRPEQADWLTEPHDWLLAITSGNAPGSPQVIDNDTALMELGGMADAWLMHDRDILARNEDSVLRVRADGTACFLRRGLGYAPTPIAMPALDKDESQGAPRDAPSVLALGGLLKATVCFTQGERALVSPHVGDLDSIDTRLTHARMADLWPGWLNAQADALACDLHPDFFSTILAAHLSHTHASASSGVAPLPVVQVQHHHAHVAAVLAEHPESKEARGPVLGLVIDGQGLGSDGHIWGGELLRVDRGDAQRLGHLRPLLLPGGEVATREPWRMAAAVLHALHRDDEITTRFGRHSQAETLHTWLAHVHAHAPHATSLGRLFDAAAGLLDVLMPRLSIGHEAEAAMRLEALAAEHGLEVALKDGWHISDELVLDWRPMMSWLADQTSPSPHRLDRPAAARLAAIFHATLAAALADWVRQAARQYQMTTIVLAGGCMANAVLDEALNALLAEAGLTVWRAGQYPCGDGALSLGQAWVARHRLTAMPHRGDGPRAQAT